MRKTKNQIKFYGSFLLFLSARETGFYIEIKSFNKQNKHIYIIS